MTGNHKLCNYQQLISSYVPRLHNQCLHNQLDLSYLLAFAPSYRWRTLRGSHLPPYFVKEFLDEPITWDFTGVQDLLGKVVSYAWSQENLHNRHIAFCYGIIAATLGSVIIEPNWHPQYTYTEGTAYTLECLNDHYELNALTPAINEAWPSVPGGELLKTKYAFI